MESVETWPRKASEWYSQNLQQPLYFEKTGKRFYIMQRIPQFAVFILPRCAYFINAYLLTPGDWKSLLEFL